LCAAELLLHGCCGVFERVPDEFPIDVFLAAVIDPLRRGVLGAGHAGQEAAQHRAVHWSSGFEQGHGGQRGLIDGQARLAEAREALLIILGQAQIIQAGGIRAGVQRVQRILSALGILGIRGVLRIVAVRRLAILRVGRRISGCVRGAVLCGTGLRRNITRRRGPGGIIVGDGRGVWRRLRICAAGAGISETEDWDAGLARLADLTWDRGQLAAISVQHRHLLEVRVLRAADNLPRGVDVDEAPGAVTGIGGIFVGLAEEMEIRCAFQQVVERLRVVAELVVVEANGAGVLIAAPDGFLLDATAANGGAHLQDGDAGSDHDQHQPQDKKEGVAGFLIAEAGYAVRAGARRTRAAKESAENEACAHWFGF